MACPFRILRLSGVSPTIPSDDLGLALVVTVRPGSATEVEAKHTVLRLCRTLSRLGILSPYLYVDYSVTNCFFHSLSRFGHDIAVEMLEGEVRAANNTDTVHINELDTALTLADVYQFGLPMLGTSIGARDNPQSCGSLGFYLNVIVGGNEYPCAVTCHDVVAPGKSCVLGFGTRPKPRAGSNQLITLFVWQITTSLPQATSLLGRRALRTT